MGSQGRGAKALSAPLRLPWGGLGLGSDVGVCVQSFDLLAE